MSPLNASHYAKLKKAQQRLADLLDPMRKMKAVGIPMEQIEQVHQEQAARAQLIEQHFFQDGQPQNPA